MRFIFDFRQDAGIEERFFPQKAKKDVEVFRSRSSFEGRVWFCGGRNGTQKRWHESQRYKFGTKIRVRACGSEDRHHIERWYGDRIAAVADGGRDG
jgi:hypothetical protein